MKLLILGASGQVGTELVKEFAGSTHEVLAWTRADLDCAQLDLVEPKLTQAQPELIINAAAYTAVDKAEEESALAFVVNSEFVSLLASYSHQALIPLIHLSTDYVFDGCKQTAYLETDAPNPQGVYARSKWAGEEALRAQLKEHIILRVSWVFGAVGANFVKTILALSSQKEALSIVSDQWGRPTAARDIARVIALLVRQISANPAFDAWGTFHYAGQGVTNWYEFAGVFLKRAGLSIYLTPIKSEEYPSKVVRPKNSVLNTEKIERVLGITCHSWEEYLPEVIECMQKQ